MNWRGIGNATFGGLVWASPDLVTGSDAGCASQAWAGELGRDRYTEDYVR